MIGQNYPWFAWSADSIRANAPALSGVYAIFNAQEWIYVGESNDIQRRLLEHFNGDNICITTHRPTGFQFELCDAPVRMRRQAELIAQLHPTCNQLAR